MHQSAQGELLCVSLHGDYRYDALKNTPAELQRQETALLEVLRDETRTRPLIVTGYSGRDRSVMNALKRAYEEQGTGILYWCGFGDHDPPTHVTELIRHARDHGRQAYFVNTLGFDDLITRIALHCLHGEHLNGARNCIRVLTPEDLLHRERFQIPHLTNATLIKSNAFGLDMPTEVFQFDLKVWPNDRVWKFLRDTAGRRPLVAVPLRKVLALGTIEDIQEAFYDNLKGSIERTPVGPDDLRFEDGAIVSLMRQALVRSMCAGAGLESDGKRIVWRPRPFRRVRRNGTSYYVHDAIVVYLRRIDTAQYLVLMPSLKVFGRNEAEPTREIAGTIKREILGYQHNKPFNEAVNSWRKTLFTKGPVSVFEFPPGSGTGFKFRVRRAPIFANIGLLTGGRTIRVPKQMRHLIKHRGLQLVEPSLLFSNRRGTGLVRDVHPIRGILRNRPYDYPLTSRGITSSLRIGVVCPRTETQALDSYLQSIHSTLVPSSNERDYLLEYPGFQAAYGLPAELPAPNEAGWITCPEPSSWNTDQGALETARLIERSIERLEASNAPDVVLIYIPDRWQRFRGYRNDSECFDLHDFVKASCVQRGIASQFLNEDTLSNS